MDDALSIIQQQARIQAIRVTQHAREEMADEEITLDEVLEAVANGQILEDYAEHKRGACCLLYGRTIRNRLCILFVRPNSLYSLLSRSIFRFHLNGLARHRGETNEMQY
jgi:hypothetical protein